MRKSERAIARGLFLGFVVALCTAAGHPATAGAWTFHSETAGFSLSLAPDWMQIPADSMPKPASGLAKDTIYGFQEKDHALFTGPMFFVVPQNYPTEEEPPTAAELGDYVQQIKTADYGNVLKSVLLESTDRMPYQAWSDAAAWDVDTKTLKLILHMSVNGGDPRMGMIALHLGRYAGMTTVCTSLEDNWESQKPLFDFMSDSFRFDNGWKYDGGNHHPLVSKTDMGIVGGALLIVLIVHFKPRKKLHIAPSIVVPPPPNGFEQKDFRHFLQTPAEPRPESQVRFQPRPQPVTPPPPPPSTWAQPVAKEAAPASSAEARPHASDGMKIFLGGL